MNYIESLNYLYERLPMFQRIGAPAIKKDLTNTIRLLDALKNPHTRFKTIHIAGTNGKGTSAHTLSAILQRAGYRTGLYTSPHLKSFTERIRVDGKEVTEEFVSTFVTRHQHLIEAINPSFFEVTVVMAFEYFNQQEVDIAIVETGLGGRLDSTNVILPEVSLITMIGWDHSDLLGDSLQQIAGEKAGIIKKGRPVVIGVDQPDLLSVFTEKASLEEAKLLTTEKYSVVLKEKSFTTQEVDVFRQDHLLYSDLKTDVTASYFLKNIPGILEVVNVLKEQGWVISNQSVVEGMAAVKKLSGLKGRWQVLEMDPFIVADISHNEPGLKELFAQVAALDLTGVHLIFGVVKDKDLGRILPLLPLHAHVYFTQSQVPRSMKAEDLQAKALALGYSGEAFGNVNEAIHFVKMKALATDLILICGSTFVVAEIDDL